MYCGASVSDQHTGLWSPKAEFESPASPQRSRVSTGAFRVTYISGRVDDFFLDQGQQHILSDGTRIEWINSPYYSSSPYSGGVVSSGVDYTHYLQRLTDAIERMSHSQFYMESLSEQLGYWKAKAELLERSHEALNQKINSLQRGGTETPPGS